MKRLWTDRKIEGLLILLMVSALTVPALAGAPAPIDTPTTYTLPAGTKAPAPTFGNPVGEKVASTVRVDVTTDPGAASTAPARAPEAPAQAPGPFSGPLADLLGAILVGVGGLVVRGIAALTTYLKTKSQLHAVQTGLTMLDEAAESAFRLKWEEKSKYWVAQVRAGAKPEGYKMAMETIGGEAYDLATGFLGASKNNIVKNVGDVAPLLKARLTALTEKAKADMAAIFSNGNSASAPAPSPKAE